MADKHTIIIITLHNFVLAQHGIVMTPVGGDFKKGQSPIEFAMLSCSGATGYSRNRLFTQQVILIRKPKGL